MKEVKSIYTYFGLNSLKNFMCNKVDFWNNYNYLIDFIPANNKYYQNDVYDSAGKLKHRAGEPIRWYFNLRKALNDNDFKKAIDLFFFIFRDDTDVKDHIKDMVAFCFYYPVTQDESKLNELCHKGDIICEKIATVFGIAATPKSDKHKPKPDYEDWIDAIYEALGGRPPAGQKRSDESYFTNALHVARHIRNTAAHSTVQSNKWKDIILFLLNCYIGTCLLLIQKTGFPKSVKIKIQDFNDFRKEQIIIKTSVSARIAVKYNNTICYIDSNAQKSRCAMLPLYKNQCYEVVVETNNHDVQTYKVDIPEVRNLVMNIDCTLRKCEVSGNNRKDDERSNAHNVEPLATKPSINVTPNITPTINPVITVSPVINVDSPKPTNDKCESSDGKRNQNARQRVKVLSVIVAVLATLLVVLSLMKGWERSASMVVVEPTEVTNKDSGGTTRPSGDDGGATRPGKVHVDTAPSKPTPSMDVWYEKGMDAYKRGDGLAAVSAFESSGTGEAYYMLGLIYENGCGNIGINNMKARKYYKQAEEKGCKKASYKLE